LLYDGLRLRKKRENSLPFCPGVIERRGKKKFGGGTQYIQRVSPPGRGTKKREKKRRGEVKLHPFPYPGGKGREEAENFNNLSPISTGVEGERKEKGEGGKS